MQHLKGRTVGLFICIPTGGDERERFVGKDRILGDINGVCRRKSREFPLSPRRGDDDDDDDVWLMFQPSITSSQTKSSTAHT